MITIKAVVLACDWLELFDVDRAIESHVSDQSSSQAVIIVLSTLGIGSNRSGTDSAETDRR